MNCGTFTHLIEGGMNHKMFTQPSLPVGTKIWQCPSPFLTSGDHVYLYSLDVIPWQSCSCGSRDSKVMIHDFKPILNIFFLVQWKKSPATITCRQPPSSPHPHLWGFLELWFRSFPSETPLLLSTPPPHEYLNVDWTFNVTLALPPPKINPLRLDDHINWHHYPLLPLSMVLGMIVWTTSHIDTVSNDFAHTPTNPPTPSLNI